jgi:hypothetical protein
MPHNNAHSKRIPHSKRNGVVFMGSSLQTPYNLSYKHPEESHTQNFYKAERDLKPRAGLGDAEENPGPLCFLRADRPRFVFWPKSTSKTLCTTLPGSVQDTVPELLPVDWLARLQRASHISAKGNQQSITRLLVVPPKPAPPAVAAPVM